MNYYSREVSEPADSAPSAAKFESNATHNIIVVPWKHCYAGTTSIKVTSSPLRIEATSYDGINYHSLELTLTLNYDVITLKDAFYKTDANGFRVHIPKENMKLRQSETTTLPEKK